MLFESLFIIFVAGLGLLTVDGMRVRELATQASRSHCQQLGLQLLDQSVSLSITRPARNDEGRITIYRRYRFEFTSTGDERYKGHIDMHHQQVSTIHLEAHRLPDLEG